jgi:hypothetical protein
MQVVLRDGDSARLVEFDEAVSFHTVRSPQDDKWLSVTERRDPTGGVARLQRAGGRTTCGIYLLLGEYILYGLSRL